MVAFTKTKNGNDSIQIFDCHRTYNESE
jgi:hypothetical protein